MKDNYIHVCTYPTLKTSASFNNAELTSIGKGYFSNSCGKRTMASDCSPTLFALNPITKAEEFFLETQK